MNKTRSIPIAVVLMSLAASIALAGVGCLFTCENEKCKFKTTVYFGGGNGYELITGFCVECDNFVYLKTKYVDKQPQPVGTILNPNTGKKIKLFTCPHCGKPFAQIPSEQDLASCPKCGQPKIKKERGSIYE